MTLREQIRRIIQAIVMRFGISDKSKLKKILNRACPYTQKEYYPHKIWLEEQRKVINPSWSDKKKTGEEKQEEKKILLF